MELGASTTAFLLPNELWDMLVGFVSAVSLVSDTLTVGLFNDLGLFVCFPRAAFLMLMPNWCHL